LFLVRSLATAEEFLIFDGLSLSLDASEWRLSLRHPEHIDEYMIAQIALSCAIFRGSFKFLRDFLARRLSKPCHRSLLAHSGICVGSSLDWP
jgi:hypothetical protein